MMPAVPNFDLVTGWGIIAPSDCHTIRMYFLHDEVLVAVMAPQCTMYGPTSKLKWVIHPQTTATTHNISYIIALLCGEVATIQLNTCYGFLH